MSEPKWCQWCGSAKSGEDGDDILFACGSWHSGSTPEYQWVQCKLNVAEQRIRRAVDWLQKAQRYDLQPLGDYQGEGMVHSNSGDYVDISDVRAAIDILQEGRQ